ncbi:MAG: hypothetical protein KGJ62_12870 [Armatimonadetes bacterium]|nr:hypothetical protein [Armatimonadota bacterium]MDE2206334.1 hypothetical protein [Armatimonadota bacterium]
MIERFRGVRLSSNEALGLLEILMNAPCDMSLDQLSAFEKLSEYCRTQLRDEERTCAPQGLCGVGATRTA